MTDTIQITTSDKIPTNVQEVPQILSSEERKKEFYKELNAIKEKALKEADGDIESAVEVDKSKPDLELSSFINIENKPEKENDNDRIDDDTFSDDDNSLDDGIKRSVAKEELDNKPIPKKRLDKEVKRREELEKRLQEEREQRIKSETELNIYTDALKKLNATQQKNDPELDPIDSDAHRFYMSKIEQLERKLEDRTQVLSENNQRMRFETTVNAQSEEFTKKQPDFANAYKYVIDREVETAKLMGISDSAAQDYVMQKLQPIALQIYSNGGNVAEAVYKMAKNYGYAPKSSTKSSNVNLQAIDKNSRKSSSIIDDVPASSTGIAQPASAYTNLEKFTENLTNADGRGTDEVKFRKLLNQIANAR